MTTEPPTKIQKPISAIEDRSDLCRSFLKDSRLHADLEQCLISVLEAFDTAVGPVANYQGGSIGRVIAAYDKLREMFASFAMTAALDETLMVWETGSRACKSLIDKRFADAGSANRMYDVLEQFHKALLAPTGVGLDKERVKGLYEGFNLATLFLWEAHALKK